MLMAIDLLALQELVIVKLPKLHKHLQALGCDMTIIATDWFLCLFATSLPSEVGPRSISRSLVVMKVSPLQMAFTAVTCPSSCTQTLVWLASGHTNSVKIFVE